MTLDARHAYYVGYVYGLARQYGLKAVAPVLDAAGDVTDRLAVEVPDCPDLTVVLVLVVPPPPDDWWPPL